MNIAGKLYIISALVDSKLITVSQGIQMLNNSESIYYLSVNNDIILSPMGIISNIFI